MVVALRAIRLSTNVVFVCEGTAVLLPAIIGIVVKVKGGYRQRARSASPFELHGPALAVGGVGEMNVFCAFSGFEGRPPWARSPHMPPGSSPRRSPGPWSARPVPTSTSPRSPILPGRASWSVWVSPSFARHAHGWRTRRCSDRSGGCRWPWPAPKSGAVFLTRAGRRWSEPGPLGSSVDGPPAARAAEPSRQRPRRRPRR
jgi:hypothetical protein